MPCCWSVCSGCCRSCRWRCCSRKGRCWWKQVVALLPRRGILEKHEREADKNMRSRKKYPNKRERKSKFSPERFAAVELISSPVGLPEEKKKIKVRSLIKASRESLYSFSKELHLPVLILINHSAPTSNTPIRNPPKAMPRTPGRPKSKHGGAET